MNPAFRANLRAVAESPTTNVLWLVTGSGVFDCARAEVWLADNADSDLCIEVVPLPPGSPRLPGLYGAKGAPLRSVVLDDERYERIVKFTRDAWAHAQQVPR